MIRTFVILVLAAASANAETLAADSARGQRLFETEHCIQCHRVNGKGGQIAPDLGRLIDRDYTPAALASTMWNHAPTMWKTMREQNVQKVSLDEQAAADLFAYFYSSRFFEKPGDAGRGKRLFTEKSCSRCHGMTEAKVAAARPVSQWQALGDPIALTEAMWNHAGSMREELAKQGVTPPRLSAQELSDLLVYLRNLPFTKDIPAVFETASEDKGKALFVAKKCQECHQSGDTPVIWHVQGETLTDVAASMWDHGLSMPAATIRFERGEMSDLISYMWAAQFFRNDGNADRGKKVFAAKHCAGCHDDAASGAPPLKRGSRTVSGVTMVSALWQHGPVMLDRMREKKLEWPRFTSREMSDVIAYLNQRDPR